MQLLFQDDPRISEAIRRKIISQHGSEIECWDEVYDPAATIFAVSRHGYETLKSFAEAVDYANSAYEGDDRLYQSDLIWIVDAAREHVYATGIETRLKVTLERAGV